MLFAAACGAPDSLDRWLDDPARVTARTWHRISVAGQHVGAEERIWGKQGRDTVVVRRRRLALEGVAGRVSGSRATLDPEGYLLAHHSIDLAGERHAWTAPLEADQVVDLDLAAARQSLATGSVQGFDPLELRVVPVEVTVVDAPVWTARWTLGGLPFVVRHDHGVEHGIAGVHQMERVDSEPRLPARPVDLGRLLRRPAPEVHAPRRTKHGRFYVDGREVLTRAPVDAAVPAPLRAQLDDLVAEVRGALSLRVTPGRPAAVLALHRGSGDCNEHVAVFVEAARTAGLEARPRTGLIFLSDAHGPGLVPHAWAEVRSGTDWVPVDPTLGQPIADAARLALDDADLLTVLTDRSIELIDAW